MKRDPPSPKSVHPLDVILWQMLGMVLGVTGGWAVWAVFAHPASPAQWTVGTCIVVFLMAVLGGVAGTLWAGLRPRGPRASPANASSLRTGGRGPHP